MTHVEVSNGLRIDDLARVAQLLNEAFASKVAYELRADSPEQALRIVERCIAPDRAWVASDPAGRIIGVAGVAQRGRPFLRVGLRTLVGEFGWFGAVPRRLRVALMHELTRPRKDEWHVEVMAVDAASRGLGVGTTLLQSVARAASQAMVGWLTLEVVDTNERASDLYRRLGFICVRTLHTGWLTRSAGFEAAHLMRLDLRQRVRAAPA